MLWATKIQEKQTIWLNMTLIYIIVHNEPTRGLSDWLPKPSTLNLSILYSILIKFSL